MYGIHFLRTRRSYTVKLRACSYRIYCCHGTQSSSAISQHAGSSALTARLRDGCSEIPTVLRDGRSEIPTVLRDGRSEIPTVLRDGRSEASTVLRATTAFQSSSAVAASSTRSCDFTCHFLRLYSALCCSYTCCFAVATLAASLRLY